MPSAVGAALALPPQPHFAIIGRGTSSSNKINATESTNPLIWTQLWLNLAQDAVLGKNSRHEKSRRPCPELVERGRLEVTWSRSPRSLPLKNIPRLRIPNAITFHCDRWVTRP
jgi:hypothetical protein